ncbi:MAG TPA: hypothetical protein VKA01_09705 [Vicinamibacteria bacterium]|nr:hypothetical protein [Vicinamibacteria bacterium]
MASSKKKAKGHAKPAKKKPAPAKKAAVKARPAHAPAKAPALKAAKGPAAKVAAPKPSGAKPATPAAAPPKLVSMKPGASAAPRPAKRSSRRSPLANRRGPDGQPFVPGDLLLPGGPLGQDELQYYFRGTAASEHRVADLGVEDVIAKRGGDESLRTDLRKAAEILAQRFETGIDPLLPNRQLRDRRTFQSVIERAKHRRREMGAFMRGLDVGRTETSHMDSHGEASLQALMEWAARLENLTEADEPHQADYAQFHRVLDQLDNTTESLIIDVERTLRRVRDRNRTS